MDTARAQFDHFMRTGPGKPLGYLPVSYIEDVGYTPDDLSTELEAQGLKTQFYGPRRLGRQTHGPALYAWHVPTLQGLIDSNLAVIERYGWPTDADRFAQQVATRLASSKESPELFELIAQAFDDERHRFLKEMKTFIELVLEQSNR